MEGVSGDNPPMETFTIDDVLLVLTRPVEQDIQWIGQEDLVEQILAAWLVVGEKDLPLCPRLLGRPGVGKTTLAYFAARAAGLPAYIHQCTADTRPEDLLVTPVLSREGKISYHASPLVSAVIRGGVAILDEANRMSEKSWASLAPLLDHRRYVESVVAGVRIPAHPSFRACITMNDDASTYEVPDYMISRIQPAVTVDFPEREEELRILKYHLPFAPDEILSMTVEFLEGARKSGLKHSTRDGINIARYALKMRERRRGGPRRPAAPPPPELRELFERSAKQVLGDDAFGFSRPGDSGKKEKPRVEARFMDLNEFLAMVEDLGDPPRPLPGGAGPKDPPGPEKPPRKPRKKPRPPRSDPDPADE